MLDRTGAERAHQLSVTSATSSIVHAAKQQILFIVLTFTACGIACTIIIVVASYNDYSVHIKVPYIETVTNL